MKYIMCLIFLLRRKRVYNLSYFVGKIRKYVLCNETPIISMSAKLKLFYTPPCNLLICRIGLVGEIISGLAQII